MSAVDLRARLAAAGVSLEVGRNGPLPVLRLTASTAPSGALLEEVRQHKAELIAMLEAQSPMPDPYTSGHRAEHRGASEPTSRTEIADFGQLLSPNPYDPYAPYGSGPAASFVEDLLEAGIYDEPEMPAPGTAARVRMEREHRKMCQGLLTMARCRW